MIGRPTVNPNHIVATILVTCIILYGSLYPFEFRQDADLTGAARELLRTWSRPPPSFGDLVANILLYVPLGFFEINAWRTPVVRRFAFTAVTGFILCVSIELLQFFDVGRVT